MDAIVEVSVLFPNKHPWGFQDIRIQWSVFLTLDEAKSLSLDI